MRLFRAELQRLAASGIALLKQLGLNYPRVSGDAARQALVIDGDTLFTNRSQQFATLAMRHALPAISNTRSFPEDGVLMSYGASNIDADRLGGVYVGRVLKGDNPADLPVQQSVKVELIVNLVTAEALGLNMPLSLLGRADEVIE